VTGAEGIAVAGPSRNCQKSLHIVANASKHASELFDIVKITDMARDLHEAIDLPE
jgi:hypothetical protein